MEESKPLQDSLLTHYSTVVESKGGTEVDVAEEGLAAVVARVRKGFNSGVTRKLDWRKQQLRAIVRMMRENFEAFSEALRADLGATEFWITSVELPIITAEAEHMLSNLCSWSKPRPVGSPMLSLPATSYLKPEPMGTVLVIAPWNYPISLALNPVVSAIAAGNAVILKPSEISSHCSNLLYRLCTKYLDPACFACVEGGVPETTALLKERYDLIMYTGNGTVGKIVMKAAANYLTPVILELGGKCPAIVTADCNLSNAVKRIAWGKWAMNLGQTCVSPDYVLVEASIKDKFVKALKDTVIEFFGEHPENSRDLSRVINENHTRRLAALLEGDDSIRVLHGGTVDVAGKFISPTIVEATPASKVMAGEIFGPILPVLPFSRVDEAIQFINEHDKPLALYVFSSSRSVKDEVLERTSAGGCCVNEVVMQVGNFDLPFGGVGDSGMGAYHGKYGFDAFSHLKPVLEKYLTDPPLRYPPYTPFKLTAMAAGVGCNRAVRPLTACCKLLFVLMVLAAFGVLIWRASLSA